jgi:hypothetical protein
LLLLLLRLSCIQQFLTYLIMLMSQLRGVPSSTWPLLVGGSTVRQVVRCCSGQTAIGETAQRCEATMHLHCTQQQ